MPPVEAAAEAASSTEGPIFWVGFMAFVVAMLVLDLKVFHKHAHEVRTKEAVGWTIFWIALALVFNAILWPWLGGQKAAEFLAAYLIEKSLSIDNLFVIVVLFQFFHVPGQLQHRVLFFGVLGAIVMRFVFILAGVALLERFTWMTFVFGAILIWTALKLLLAGDAPPDPSKNMALKLAKKWFRFTDEYHGDAMTVVKDGVRWGTPLLLVLIVIEATDVVFAVDSVPACLAVSKDPFIVFTSNIFAILGLRALYFVLARFLGSFRFLKYGLVVILAFIGVKMILQGLGKGHMPISVSLGVIGGVLALATVASILFPGKPEHAPASAAAEHEGATPAAGAAPGESGPGA